MADAAKPLRTVNSHDESYDVVVVGYGYAGGVSALEAARAGARILLLIRRVA